METRKVKLTKTQVHELRYVISYLIEESFDKHGNVFRGSMFASYGITRFEKASALKDKLDNSRGTLELSFKEAAFCHGELKNRYEIESDNAEDSGPCEFRVRAKKMWNGVERVRAVFPEIR